MSLTGMSIPFATPVQYSVDRVVLDARITPSGAGRARTRLEGGGREEVSRRSDVQHGTTPATHGRGQGAEIATLRCATPPRASGGWESRETRVRAAQRAPRGALRRAAACRMDSSGGIRERRESRARGTEAGAQGRARIRSGEARDDTTNQPCWEGQYDDATSSHSLVGGRDA
eukprot:9044884-Pyramimonas_sp.AAC.1